ncbi:reverse gyrase [Sulfolobales archaeon HS-7]|nr:reverse gyrase [Sulfolobales archaeon HS-7]
MRDVPEVYYLNGCPNCGGTIDTRRLEKGSLCDLCVSEEINFTSYIDLLSYLNSHRKLKNLEKDWKILQEYERLRQYFKKSLSVEPSTPQRAWFLDLLRGESFALISPPGLGKTTFGLLSAVYLFTIGKRSLLIFPSKALVRQAQVKIGNISNSLNINPRIYVKDKDIEKLVRKDYDISLLTSKFVLNHIDSIIRGDPDFVFVDDVDAAMKSGRSALGLLKLAGFSEEDVTAVRNALRIKGNKAYDEIGKIREKKNKRIIVFSSASLTRSNPLFTTLMGFRPGSSVIYTRNIFDVTVRAKQIPETIRDINEAMRGGGLIFVPIDLGIEYANELSLELNELGVKSLPITSSKALKSIKAFEEGEVDLLVGTATHYGILVRGLDIPWRIKYAFFTGIPRFKFKLGEKMHPIALSRILGLLSIITRDREVSIISSYLRNKLNRMSPAAVSMLYSQIKGGVIADRTIEKAYELVQEYVKNKPVLSKLTEISDIVLEDNTMLIPDHLTYIQASGRTSRLFAGGLTTGISFLYVDNESLFQALNNKLNIMLDSVTWKEIDELNLDEISTNINAERKIITEYKQNKVALSIPVRTTLFVVESPSKAKTIANFFSKPSQRNEMGLQIYETVMNNEIMLITYTAGHIYDLTTDKMGEYGVIRKSASEYIPVYDTIKRCENGHQVVTGKERCPACQGMIVSDKENVVDALRNIAIKCDRILIGTDPDTEGEKIAWDVYNTLRPFNPEIYRAEFHEVTRKAIIQAISNARKINYNLVSSQIVRRVEDRWIGFELSTKLQTDFWRKYCKGENCEGNRNLSAGRVQTPVLGWIINRYNVHERDKVKVLPAKLPNGITFLIERDSKIRKGTKIKLYVKNLGEFKEAYNPLPPYNTSTVLQDSSSFYSISSTQAMRILQDLFETGLITYHRTDSIRISEQGVSVAMNYLKNKYGEQAEKLAQPRSWGEGGAHEAIRPTRPLDAQQLQVMIQDGTIVQSKELSRQHFLIYELIFRRFIASQMKPQNVIKQVIEVNALVKGTELKLRNPKAEFVIGYEGEGFLNYYSPFRRVYPKVTEGEYDVTLGSGFIVSSIDLYTEGELISDMERKEIGRPSTYATIIATLLRRRYVFETSKMKKMFPSKIGMSVYEYLNESYGKLVSEERTRELQRKMDEVEMGNIDYQKVIDQLYNEITEIRGG